MKLTITTQLCIKLIISCVTVLGLLNKCMAAPLDTYYPTDDSDEVSLLSNPQRLQLLKDLREMIAMEDKNNEVGMKPYAVDKEPSGLWRVMPQKRLNRPFRTQTRAGNGVIHGNRNSSSIAVATNDPRRCTTLLERWCRPLFMESLSSRSMARFQAFIGPGSTPRDM